MFLQNDGNQVQDHKTSQPRKPQCTPYVTNQKWSGTYRRGWGSTLNRILEGSCEDVNYVHGSGCGPMQASGSDSRESVYHTGSYDVETPCETQYNASSFSDCIRKVSDLMSAETPAPDWSLSCLIRWMPRDQLDTGLQYFSPEWLAVLFHTRDVAGDRIFWVRPAVDTQSLNKLRRGQQRSLKYNATFWFVELKREGHETSSMKHQMQLITWGCCVSHSNTPHPCPKCNFKNIVHISYGLWLEIWARRTCCSIIPILRWAQNIKLLLQNKITLFN
jgi:hypothetical protein